MRLFKMCLKAVIVPIIVFGLAAAYFTWAPLSWIWPQHGGLVVSTAFAAPVDRGLQGGPHNAGRARAGDVSSSGRHDNSWLDRVARWWNGESRPPRGDFRGDPLGRSWLELQRDSSRRDPHGSRRASGNGGDKPGSDCYTC